MSHDELFDAPKSHASENRCKVCKSDCRQIQYQTRRKYERTKLLQADDGYEADFTEAEIGRLTEAEYELANLRHEQFLEHERAERERLDREFEAELEALWKTMEAGGKEATATDPPGWPGL